MNGLGLGVGTAGSSSILCSDIGTFLFRGGVPSVDSGSFSSELPWDVWNHHEGGAW